MKTTTSIYISLGVLLASLALGGCNDDPAPSSVGSNSSPAAPASSNTPAAQVNSSISTATEYVQVERLARPAINEGLVITNDYLNAFNSIPPDQDLSDAAAPVRAEAITVLTVLNRLGTGLHLHPPTPLDVAAGFLPDVMRIDVSRDLTSTATAYNSCVDLIDGITGQASLCGGRKIKDDVMDITLSYLIAGDPSDARPVRDGVDYSGAKGWHHALLADFPFLATPVISD